MPQPLSHPDLRRRNLALLLGTLLRRQAATRKEIEQESGLSKATVSRLSDELLQSGILLSRSVEPAEPSARGRRAETLFPSASLGFVAGLSLGLHTSSVFISDLTGQELAWEQHPTPEWETFAEAVAWSARMIERAAARLSGPVRRVVVAIPGRALDGTIVTRPPLFMATIEGDAYGTALAERLGCPIRIELDAAMVLVGLERLDFVDAHTAPVLLNASSILTMSLRRRDGSIARGLTASFGDFSLIPLHTEAGELTLGQLLGAHGLQELATQLGEPLGAIEELWGDAADPDGRVRRLFGTALVQAMRIIAVLIDPSLIIFTGRLSPLIRDALPEVDSALRAELHRPPELRVIGHAENGYPAAVGGAHEAREEAVAELLDEVSRSGIVAPG